MKKLICLPLLTLLISFANVAGVVSAAPLDGCNDQDPGTACNVLGDPCAGITDSTLCDEANKTQTAADNGIFGVNGILNKATNLLIIVIGIAGVIMIIVGGIKYTLSSGDPKNINSAKDLIIYAIVGMVIAVAAKGIIAFVINKL